MAVDFIGAGWAYPLASDTTGRVALVDGSDDVERAMRLVLGTSYGERPMRPEFGCGIHELIFAPIDATTAGRLAHEVRASLVRWEPRIDVIEVQVLVEDEAPATLYIDVTYVLRGTNDPRNLVFPFYTIPEETP